MILSAAAGRPRPAPDYRLVHLDSNWEPEKRLAIASQDGPGATAAPIVGICLHL